MITLPDWNKAPEDAQLWDGECFYKIAEEIVYYWSVVHVFGGTSSRWMAFFPVEKWPLPQFIVWRNIAPLPRFFYEEQCHSISAITGMDAELKSRVDALVISSEQEGEL